MELKNYVTIYNGLGLEEIVIDFTKCRNNIIVVVGDNGSGKSSLLNALHIMPDGNDTFIEGKRASKLIHLQHNEALYKIKFIHDVNSKGIRQTTKAYMEKYINDRLVMKYCESGNVTEYKEAVKSEFNLDNNFISLSKLSSEDKGMVDKTPANRKKYVNSILDGVEVYNQLFKTLNKRSSIQRSFMNNIISKIESLGNKDKLVFDLSSISNQLEILTNNKNDISNELIRCEEKINILDGDRMIQNRYNSIILNIKELEKELLDISRKYNGNISNTIKDYNETKELLSKANTNAGIYKSKIDSVQESLNEVNKKLFHKKNKLSSINIEDVNINYDREIEDCKYRINDIREILNDSGYGEKINKDEYIICVNMLKEISSHIDTIKDVYEADINKQALDYVNSNKYPDIDIYDSQLESLIDAKENTSSELNRYYNLKEVSKVLSDRPTKCKIDSCKFISTALDAHKKNPDKNISILENKLEDINKEISNVKKLKSDIKKVHYVYRYIINILTLLDKNSQIIASIPILTNIRGSIISAISSSTTSISEISQLLSKVELYDIYDEFERINEYMNKLIKKKEENIGNVNIYKELNNDINELTEEKKSLLNKEGEFIDNMNSNEDRIKELSSNILFLENKLKDEELYNKLDNELKQSISERDNLKSNIEEIYTLSNTIKELKNNLERVSSELIGLSKVKSSIEFKLTQLEEYEKELSIYNDKFQKIDMLKKYCSPTKEGIQTLFMNIHLSKTIKMTNELLSHLFGGSLSIQDYIITENRFQIPVVSEDGLPRDDISSLSKSQKAMVSMIISFVMLKQSSIDYNILTMDEVDEGLDTANRRMFVEVLYKLISILDISQVIMVTHNIELDLSNTDIILLKSSNINIPNGNIIYRF